MDLTWKSTPNAFVVKEVIRRRSNNKWIAVLNGKMSFKRKTHTEREIERGGEVDNKRERVNDKLYQNISKINEYVKTK